MPSPRSPTPDRRRFLGGLAALVPAALAGCAETAGEKPKSATPAKKQTPMQDERPALPVEERWDLAARRIEEAAAADVADVDEFTAAVERGGPSVSSTTEHETVLELKCELDPDAEGGTVPAVGHVAGTYAALVRGGTPFTRVDVSLLDGGDTYGSFQLHEEWAERYESGGWSAADYGEAALGTLKTKR